MNNSANRKHVTIYAAGNGYIVELPPVISEQEHQTFMGTHKVKVAEPQTPFVFHSFFDMAVFLAHYFKSENLADILYDDVELTPESYSTIDTSSAELAVLKKVVRDELTYGKPKIRKNKNAK